MAYLGSQAAISFGGTVYYSLKQLGIQGTTNVVTTEVSSATGAVTKKDAGATNWRVTGSIVIDTGVTQLSALKPGTEAATIAYPEGVGTGKAGHTWTTAVIQDANLVSSVGDHAVLDVVLDCEGDATIAAQGA